MMSIEIIWVRRGGFKQPYSIQPIDLNRNPPTPTIDTWMRSIAIDLTDPSESKPTHVNDRSKESIDRYRFNRSIEIKIHPSTSHRSIFPNPQ